MLNLMVMPVMMMMRMIIIIIVVLLVVMSFARAPRTHHMQFWVAPLGSDFLILVLRMFAMLGMLVLLINKCKWQHANTNEVNNYESSNRSFWPLVGPPFAAGAIGLHFTAISVRYVSISLNHSSNCSSFPHKYQLIWITLLTFFTRKIFCPLHENVGVIK